MWFIKNLTVAPLNETSPHTMMGWLDIQYTALTPISLEAQMPVNERTKQPMGILHGGASVVLAETVGTMAANLVVNQAKSYAVGMAINANHVRQVKNGYVYAKATPAHLGKKTHVWTIHITNDMAQLVCISRLTVAVLDKKV